MTIDRESTWLSSVQIQFLREELEELLQQRAGRLDGLRRIADGQGDGETNADWQSLPAAIEAAERAVAETRNGLERLAAGGYGRCEDCAVEIPFERLKIRPLTRYCVTCQRKHEFA
ncbi:TraR/DksA family transcriptional regulator [Bailinhaonella thermotolerans]|uniref:TraR/DksA family transcriptional regulator n=1 Tax=Bailinhaonella thermotolerans TaxID=1070861 RepID=A0A3A4AY52_9ACTN|nr:TraR/DksA family transcriptional regulator [Bailinhaonella thermotolerans]RJL26518.1 TraR/DksA family transcriptional regulator [Bailinhaonella thermotolerans]